MLSNLDRNHLSIYNPDICSCLHRLYVGGLWRQPRETSSKSILYGSTFIQMNPPLCLYIWGINVIATSSVGFHFSVFFHTNLHERENHTSFKLGKVATNCGRAIEFPEPYFFVLMVQIYTFFWFSISLEWASKRDILCGSERTSTLTICKLKGEEVRGNVFYVYCSLCVFGSQLHCTCVWFLKDGRCSKTTATLCEYILLCLTRICLSTILRLCSTGVTVAVSYVTSGTCNGPDCCKTDMRMECSWFFQSFLSFLLLLVFFFPVRRKNWFEQKNFPNLLLSDGLCGPQSTLSKMYWAVQSDQSFRNEKEK